MVKETLVVQGICYSCVLLLRPQYCRTTVKKKEKKKKVFTGILQSFEKRYTFTASIGINYGNPNQIHLIS